MASRGALLQEWADSAAQIGDADTFAIAEIALGSPVIYRGRLMRVRTGDLDRGGEVDLDSLALTPRRRADLSRLTPRGAARIAKTW